jgi:hypothetical protein
MKQKMIWRYYCEFCKKSSCSKSAMKKHERRCTSNPSRECGLCLMADGGSGYIKECLAVLKSHVGMGEGVLPEEIVDSLDQAANNCPACTYAALKQSGLTRNFPIERIDYHGAIEAAFKERMSDLHDEYVSVVGYMG